MSQPHRVAIELHGLPRIDTVKDLAAHTRLSEALLWRLLYIGDGNYRRISIPKKSGGQRLIAEPSVRLKALQSWILRHILDHLHVTPNCRGFELGSKLADNVRPHIGAKAILCLDIEDFFPSVGVPRVVNIFKLTGYAPTAARILAQFCTFQGGLPQGAPTSPKLANLCCYRLDRRLSRFAGMHGLVYTRYADDMTFSGFSPQRLAKCLPMLKRIVQESGFALNERKTRLMGPSRRLKVTGLVVTHESAGIGREKLRVLRARILRLHHSSSAEDVPSLQGWLCHVADVDPARYQILTVYVRRLLHKRPDSVLSAIRLPQRAGAQ